MQQKFVSESESTMLMIVTALEMGTAAMTDMAVDVEVIFAG